MQDVSEKAIAVGIGTNTDEQIYLSPAGMILVDGEAFLMDSDRHNPEEVRIHHVAVGRFPAAFFVGSIPEVIAVDFRGKSDTEPAAVRRDTTQHVSGRKFA